VIIVVAATYPPCEADQIAIITGLGSTFVGSILVALSPSVPEIVVGKAALQMGAVDLAVGNVLGSNLFNVLILAIDDFFLKGPLLSSVSPRACCDGVCSHDHDGNHYDRPDVPLLEANPLLFLGFDWSVTHL
jgi:Sodium/calcium exchanger protein